MMAVESFPMPRNLVDAVELDENGRRAWMQTLPGTVERLERLWSLTVGDPYQPGGQTAWVAPARTESGDDVVLKVAWRHAEAVHEADGLRSWAGRGAVLLHATEAFDDTRRAPHRALCAGHHSGISTRERAGHRDRVAPATALARTGTRTPVPTVAGHVRVVGGRIRAQGGGPTRRHSTPASPVRASHCCALCLRRPIGACLLCTDLHAGECARGEAGTVAR